MYYKNYWVNYNTLGSLIVICEMTEDMTEFKNTESIHDFDKIKKIMYAKRSDYEDVRNHLDANGLFLGIFPPEVVEKDIEDYNRYQIEKYAILKEQMKAKYEFPWEEDFFVFMKDNGVQLDNLIKELQVSNMMSKDYFGKDFSIERDYMKYIKKYWNVIYDAEKGVFYGE